MKVAIRALKRRSPLKLVVAIPVAPPDTLADLANEADCIVCLSQPAHFQALAYHYRSFPQLTDEEVKDALAEAAQRRSAVQLRVGRNAAKPRAV